MEKLWWKLSEKKRIKWKLIGKIATKSKKREKYKWKAKCADIRQINK